MILRLGFTICKVGIITRKWGRFINADALLDSGHDLLGHNLFAYCNNNAVNMVDPDGYSPFWDMMTSNVEAFSWDGFKHSVKAGWDNVKKSYTKETVSDRLIDKALAGAVAVLANNRIVEKVPERILQGPLTNGITRVATKASIKAGKKAVVKGTVKTVASALFGPYGTLVFVPDAIRFLNGFDQGYRSYNPSEDL